MPTFSTVANQTARKPPGLVVLDPQHYAADYPNVPRSPVAVGVFPISEESLQVAMAEAAKEARLYYPEAEEDDELLNKQLEESLMKLAVARAICDPNDVGKPFFQQPEDEVEEAWPPATIRRVWDELERVTIATSPIVEPVTDDEIAKLRELLAKGTVSKLSTSQQLRARKLLRFLLEELAPVAELYES